MPLSKIWNWKQGQYNYHYDITSDEESDSEELSELKSLKIIASDSIKKNILNKIIKKGEVVKDHCIASQKYYTNTINDLEKKIKDLKSQQKKIVENVFSQKMAELSKELHIELDNDSMFRLFEKHGIGSLNSNHVSNCQDFSKIFYKLVRDQTKDYDYYLMNPNPDIAGIGDDLVESYMSGESMRKLKKKGGRKTLKKYQRYRKIKTKKNDNKLNHKY